MAAPLCGAKPVERCLVQTSPCVRPGGTSHRPRPTQTRSRCHIPSVSTYACPCWTSHPAAARGVQARSFQPDTASATTSLAEAALLAKYQALLAMAAKLYDIEAATAARQAQHSAEQATSAGRYDPNSLLNKFVRTQPEAVSVPFLSWLASQEAAAKAEGVKQRFAFLCERLVIAREVLEQERFDELYINTVAALTAGDKTEPHAPDNTHTDNPHTDADTASSSEQVEQERRERVARIAFSPPPTPSQSSARALASLPAASSNGAHSTPSQPLLQPQQTATGPETDSAETDSPYQTAISSSGHRGSNDSAMNGTTNGPTSSDSSSSGRGLARGSASSTSSASSNGTEAAMVSGTSTSGASLARLADPAVFALRVVEAVTGQPVALSGYSDVYDAVLAVAPPAALSPEGLALAHKQADDLSQDLASRRKRSVASILGRTKVSAEQMGVLMAGSPSARILDLLLGLQTHEERVDLLPDCFTPPDPASAQTGPEADNADTDELWCTPAQLLSEIDGRLRALEADSKQDVGREGMRKQLASVDGQLVGAALRDALTELRVAVNAAMLESLARGPA